MEYVVWAVIHLGLWGLLLLSAAGIGELLLRRHTFDSTVERVVFTTALGLGSSAVIIFLLGLAGLMYRGVLIGFTIPSALFALVRLSRGIKALPVRDLLSRLNTHPLRAVIVLTLFLGAVGYWACLLVPTQYPPIAWDATDEHLVVPREFLAAHRPVAIMGIVMPVLPALNHTLFAWGMALGDDVLPQMIEHTFLMLTALGLYAWGRRRRRPWLGVALGAFWLSNPLVLWLGESAYVDICVVCFVFVGVYALRVFWQKRDAGWWYLAMALLGMAGGAKLSGLFFAAVGMAIGLVVFIKSNLIRKPQPDDEQVRPEPVRLVTLAVGWGVGVLVLAPWYGFIFFHTGDPFWPAFPQFARGVWGAPVLVESTKKFFSYSPEPRTIISFLTLPVEWIRHPERFFIGLAQPLNPLLLIWPLAWAVAIWNREVRWWTLWALIFTVYWFLHAQDLRYWLPALPLLGVALLESFLWIVERARAARWSTAVFVTLTAFCLLYGARYVHGGLKNRDWPPTTTEARERYLSRVGGYPAVSYINKRAEPGDVVVVIYGSWLVYHLKPEAIDMYGFLQIGKFPRFHWPEDEQWVKWLESRKVNWILVNHEGASVDPLKIPKEDPGLHPFWPDYLLVYSQRGSWVFRHKSLPDLAGDRVGTSGK